MLELFRSWGKRGSAAADGVDRGKAIDQCRYVVMDTELTGLDRRKDSIVSIGAIAMDGGRILLGRRFYEILSPETALTSESVVVHGITPQECRNKPCIGDVIGDFLRFCEGAVVVGHFLSLDLGFLNKELKRLTGRAFGLPAVDTMRVHAWIQEHDTGFQRHYNGADEELDLFSLARKHQVPVSAAHDAQMDAFITAQLFQRFLRSLPRLGVETVKDLLRIGRP